MPLETCRECKNPVSPNARVCPQCGAPYPARKVWNGTGYEWKSQASYLGIPLVHIAFGRDANNKLRVAKGIIAIGQFAIGLIAIAQFGIGILFGFGQFIIGFTALAQFALAAYFGVGQIATGYTAIGQIAIGYYALAQAGYGVHIWSTNIHEYEALEYFNNLLGRFGIQIGGTGNNFWQ